MARKTVNRKELRAQVEAAEARGTKKAVKKPTKKATKKAAKTAKKAASEKPDKKVAAKKTAAKRTTKKKVAKETRMKAYWGVFNQSMKRLLIFEYADKRAAEKKAKDLSESQRNPHIVQLVKEPITE
jgi:hypothetical protein